MLDKFTNRKNIVEKWWKIVHFLIDFPYLCRDLCKEFTFKVKWSFESFQVFWAQFPLCVNCGARVFGGWERERLSYMLSLTFHIKISIKPYLTLWSWKITLEFLYVFAVKQKKCLMDALSYLVVCYLVWRSFDFSIWIYDFKFLNRPEDGFHYNFGEMWRLV